MSWVAVAIAGSAVVGAVASNSAANKQASAQQNAANMQLGMFNTLQGNEQPYMQSGAQASQSLNQLMGLSGNAGDSVGTTGLKNGYLTQQFDPNSLDANPAYQFALKTGGQATRNADTPGVGALSGAALKDLTAFNVGTANSYENQYFNQFQTQQNNIYQRLSGIAGLGQNAAAGTGKNGAQLGTGAAQAVAGAGASQAAGIVGGANAVGSGASSLAGLMYLNAGSNGSAQGFSGYGSGAVSNAGNTTPYGPPVSAAGN